MIRGWLRKKLRAFLRYDPELEALSERLVRLHTQLEKTNLYVAGSTDIAVDAPVTRYEVGTVIVVGRYKGGDMVKVFSLGHTDLTTMVDHLQSMEKHLAGTVRHVDAPREMTYFIREKMDT
jgi:hypothetical protein